MFPPYFFHSIQPHPTVVTLLFHVHRLMFLPFPLDHEPWTGTIIFVCSLGARIILPGTQEVLSIYWTKVCLKELIVANYFMLDSCICRNQLRVFSVLIRIITIYYKHACPQYWARHIINITHSGFPQPYEEGILYSCISFTTFTLVHFVTEQTKIL